MFRLLAVSAAFGIAASWASGHPTVAPKLTKAQQHLAQLFEQASIALDKPAHRRRGEDANIERVSEFPEGSELRVLARSVGILWIDITDAAAKVTHYQCTAAVIATATLVTNEHCLRPDAPGDKVALEFSPEFLDGIGAKFKIETTPLEADADLDYALLRVLPAADGRLPLPIARVALREALPGERLVILHHSDGKALQVTRTRCRVADIAAARPSDLRHTCALRGGSSGAVILAERDQAIVGIHKAGFRHSDAPAGLATRASVLLSVSAVIRRAAYGGSHWSSR